MPTGQQYATNVPQTFLTGQINPTATVMSVNSSSGWPVVFPFTAILEIGTSLQEPIDVTNISGTTWTVVRAIDGTVGFTHNPNATVTHGDIGRDFREARAHLDAVASNDSTGNPVHGLAVGSHVVGTTDTQTLTGKTISAGTYTGAQAMGSGAWSGTGSVEEVTLQYDGLTGANNVSRLAGRVTVAGPPTTGTFAVGDRVMDTVLGGDWLCVTAGSPGSFIWTGSIPFVAANVNGANSATLNIPSWATPANGFNTLRVDYLAHTNNTGGSGVDFFNMQINGNSTANYAYSYNVNNVGGTAGGASASAQTSAIAGLAGANAGSVASPGRGFVEIPLFADTTFSKNWNWQAGAGTGATGFNASGMGQLSLSQSAMTSITFLTNPNTNNFTNSTFRMRFF